MEDLKQNLIGKNVIIRTYSAGVHFGKLVLKEYTPAGTIVVLEKSRRIFSWEGANTISDLSTYGTTKIDDCKISLPTRQIELTAIEINEMTDVASECLYGSDYWKVSKLNDTEIDKILNIA